MNARLLDVLHDAGDKNVFPIRDRVNIDLGRVAHIGVEKQGILAQNHVDLRVPVAGKSMLNIGRNERRECGFEIFLQRRLVGQNRHGAAAQHVGGPHDDGEADLFAFVQRLLYRIGDTIVGLPEIELFDERLEPVAVLGEIDGVRRGAENRHILRMQRLRELQRRLTAELHDHAFQLTV